MNSASEGDKLSYIYVHANADHTYDVYGMTLSGNTVSITEKCDLILFNTPVICDILEPCLIRYWAPKGKLQIEYIGFTLIINGSC